MSGPYDFETRLDEILGHHEDRSEPYDEISASSLGYCPRQMLTSKLGLKQFPDSVEAQMFLGTGIHKAFQDADLYSDPVIEEFETEVSETYEDAYGDETTIVGHFDARDENGVIYDWKTIAGLDYVQDEPKPHHEDQLQTYLNLADEDRGELVYVRRWIDKDGEDPMPVVQHSVERDEQYFQEELVTKAHHVRRLTEYHGPAFAEAGVIPEDVLPAPCESFFCEVEDLDEEKVVPTL